MNKQEVQELLDNATKGEWLTMPYDESGIMITDRQWNGICLLDISELGDAKLIAAAPSLAKAYIDKCNSYGVQEAFYNMTVKQRDNAWRESEAKDEEIAGLRGLTIINEELLLKQEQEIAGLKAHVERLRVSPCFEPDECVNQCVYCNACADPYLDEEIEHAKTCEYIQTPQQSLAERDNRLIRKCASKCLSLEKRAIGEPELIAYNTGIFDSHDAILELEGEG